MSRNCPSRILLLVPVFLFALACGSSQTSVTAPTGFSGVTRCAMTAQTASGQVPAQGGAGTVTVAAARDCTWSASAEGSWLSITGGRTGQGEGVVSFMAAVNPDPTPRRGAVVLDDTRVEIIQAAASCQITLGESGMSFGQSGGTGQVEVRASSSLCGWTAETDASWIALSTRSGQGSAQVVFDVQPSAGQPRSALISIGGQRFSVTQSEGCTFDVQPTAHTLPSVGGAATTTVTAPAGCPWTAAPNEPWISIAGPSSGTGSGTVTLAVVGTSGPSRTGSAVVAGQHVVISQTGGEAPAPPPPAPAPPAPPAPPTPPEPTPSCTYTIAPGQASVPAAGGTGQISVTSQAGCGWTAVSSSPWLSITAGATGAGTGSVQYTAQASGGAARAGTITVAGHTFTVQQAQACTFTLSSSGVTMSAGGGTGAFTVQTSVGCTWTATSAVPWITVTNGASGSGGGTVNFQVAGNTGAPRTGVITAGGETFTVQQGSGCSFGVSPTSAALPASGGSGSVAVTTATACSWTAQSSVPWLTVTSTASATGSGNVTFTATPNTGAARSGTLIVAGQTVSVTQAADAQAECRATVTPDSVELAASGGTTQLKVTIGPTCDWTAESGVAWIRIPPGSASGRGDGQVVLQIERNTGIAREGIVTIAGVRVRITQAAN